jgi:hypothetical protein
MAASLGRGPRCHWWRRMNAFGGRSGGDGGKSSTRGDSATSGNGGGARKAELVRDRLQSLDQIARSYPEGHDTRVLLENLHLERALRAVEEDIRTLRDALLYPRGT